MFCDNCGSKIEDGQPFCPNCGSRVNDPEAAPAAAPEAPEAPAAPAPAVPEAPAVPAAPKTPTAPKAPAAGSGLLKKFNALQGLERLYYLCTGALLAACFLLSLLKVFKPYAASYQFAIAAPFFASVFAVLFTLSITFFLMDYFDKFTFKLLYFFYPVVSAFILAVFVITWIDVESKLSFGGWVFLLYQTALTVVSILLLLEKLKKK